MNYTDWVFWIEGADDNMHYPLQRDIVFCFCPKGELLFGTLVVVSPFAEGKIYEAQH